MKYKVGDKVRVRKDLSVDYDCYPGIAKEMADKAGDVVTISAINYDYYEIVDDEWNWTDEMFEGLAEGELTAEEAIRLKIEMCEEMSCSDCEMGKSNNNMGISCNEFQKKHPERAAKILKQWKKDHEKKEVETEFVYLIRVMEEEDDSSTCIYTYEVKEDKDDIDEKMDELVKQYYEENGGKIYAKLERICRVKS